MEDPPPKSEDESEVPNPTLSSSLPTMGRRKSLSVQSRKSIVMQRPDPTAQAIARRNSITSEVTPSVGASAAGSDSVQAWGEKVKANPTRIWSAGSFLMGRPRRMTRESELYEHAFPLHLRLQALQCLSQVHRMKEQMPPWRKNIYEKVIKNKSFERVTFALIVMNCVSLALEDPTSDSNSGLNEILKYFEYFFTTCFALEMGIKIAGLGLVVNGNSYLRDPWCVLDGLIVVVGITVIIVPLCLGNEGQTDIGGLRSIRILKPLRTVNHLQEVRLIVTSLLRSLPRLGDVLLLFCVFIVIMGVFAIQMWKGVLMNRCSVIPGYEPAPFEEAEERVCAGRNGNLGFHGFQCPWGYECISANVNPFYNQLSFDDLPSSLLTLFTAVTMEGWTDTMYHVMDGSSEFAFVFFILLILCGSFFISNLALVMISIAFFEAKEREENKDIYENAPTKPLANSKRVSCFSIETKGSGSSKGKDVDNHEHDDADSYSSQIEKKKPQEYTDEELDQGKSRFQLFVKSVIRRKEYEIFITTSIIANTLSMAIEHHNQPQRMTQVLEILNIIFTIIFALETIFKLYAYKFKPEFLVDRMNVFDAAIGILGVADIIQNQITGNKTGISVLRSLRLARIFKQFKGLWATTTTILKSLEGVSVLTLLLVLVIFVYGLLGSQLFGGAFCNFVGEETYVYSSIDTCALLPRSNFDHLGYSTLTVFQIITGEDWNTVMYNGMRAAPKQNRPWWIHALYFVSLFLIGNVIVLNLFIAVLINNFEGDDEEEDEDLPDHNTVSEVPEKTPFMLCCCCKRENARVEPIPEQEPSEMIPVQVQLLIDELSKNTSTEEDRIKINDVVRNATSTPMDEALLLVPLNKIGWDVDAREFPNALTVEESCELRNDINKIFSDESSVRSMPPALEHLLVALDEIEVAPDGRKQVLAAVSETLGPYPEVTLIAKRYGWAADYFLVPLNGITAGFMKEDLEAQYYRNCANASVSTAAFFTQVAGDDFKLEGRTYSIRAKSISITMQHQGTEEEDNSMSLWVLSMQNPVRKVLYFIATHKYFEALVIFLIIVSTVSLASVNPMQAPDELLPTINRYVDLILTICFAVECGIKVLAHGFVLHETSYLRRDGWNRLDFVIVVFSLVALSFQSSSSAQKLEVFRMMRTLRPLRFINKSEGLKMVVLALISSIPPLANIAFVTTLVFVLFGILGVQFFAGSFYACSDAQYGDISFPNYGSNLTGITTEEMCIALGYRWENNRDNFDNLLYALISLFEVSTLEGWVGLMELGMDSVGPGHAGLKYNKWYMCVYFIIFIVIVSFFIINLFIGVLIDQYNSARELNEVEKWVGLTDSQVQWIAVQDTILLNTPKMNKQSMTPWRRKLFLFVQHSFFNRFITVGIAVNVAIMSTEHHNQSDAWGTFLETSNLTFLILFACEAAVKLLALGPVGYFRDPWNKFDFFLVFMSFVGLVVTNVSADVVLNGLFKPLRLARLLRVVRTAAGVRALLKTLIKSLGSLVNVAGLLSLLFFLYAVLGVDLFGRVQRGKCITDHANFESFHNAIILLFRMSTGEGWQCVMNDARLTDGLYCSDHLGNCGDPVLAVLYFISFMLLGMYVMLNVFIAIILSGYECVAMEENALLNEDHVAEFYTEWEKRDPCETRLIPISLVPGHLRALSPPLGYGVEGDPQTQALFKKTLLQHIGNRCWSYNNQVCYQEVLMALVEFNLFKYGIAATDVGSWEKIVEMYRKRWKSLHGERYDEELVAMRDGKAKTSLAAMQIQRIFRGRRGRKRAREQAGGGSGKHILGFGSSILTNSAILPRPPEQPTRTPITPKKVHLPHTTTDGVRTTRERRVSLSLPNESQEQGGVCHPGSSCSSGPLPPIGTTADPPPEQEEGPPESPDDPPNESFSQPDAELQNAMGTEANPAPQPLKVESSGPRTPTSQGEFASGDLLPVTPHSSNSTDDDKRVYPKHPPSSLNQEHPPNEESVQE